MPETKRDAGSTFADLNKLLPPGSAEEATTSFTVTTEDKRVRDARLEEERKENDARRHKDTVLFWACLVAYFAIGVVACVSAWDEDPTHLARATWTRSIVGALIGGLAGLMLGRSGRR